MNRIWIIIAITGLMACEENEVEKDAITWTFFGIENKTINELDREGDWLFASTESGLYKNRVNGSSGDWECIALEGQSVLSFQVITNDLWLLSQSNASQPESSSLYQSTDQGDTWSKINAIFGDQTPEPLNDLAYDKETGLIYGTGTSVVAVSNSNAQSWSTLYGDWGGFGSGTDFIAINPHNNDELWAGGQGAIENGFLLRSENAGSEWTEWQELVENPTVAKVAAFGHDDADEVLIGFEGALIHSGNGGSSWETLIHSPENRFFFGTAFSNRFESRIYAAGWLKDFENPQPLKLFISDDNGETWREEGSGVVAFGGVTDMIRLPADDVEVFLLGCWKGGLVKVLIRE